MAFDPAEHTIPDVEQYLRTNPNQTVRVHDLERDGKGRVSLLDWIDHFAEDRGIDLTPDVQAADPLGAPITLSPDHVTIPQTVTVEVVGTGFTATSQVAFNNGLVPTTFVTDRQVTFDINSTGVGSEFYVFVWVVTDGVSTQEAQFWFREPVVEPGPPSTDVLTLQLRSWGISGEPVTWAPSGWHAVIFATRAANQGFGTPDTVQGLLDTTFPDAGISAADIIVVPGPPDATITPTLGATVGTIVLSVPTQGVPGENVRWLVDGVDAYQGYSTPDLVLPLGVHQAYSYISLSGTVYSATRVGTVTPDTTKPPGSVKWVDQ